MKTSRMNDLTTNLMNLIEDVKNGNVSSKDADSMSNAAGKAINSVRSEMEYEFMKQKQGVKLDIPVMRKTGKKGE